MLRGAGVSQGIAYAKAKIWQTAITYDYIPRKGANPAIELERFETARAALQSQTGHLRRRTARIFGEKQAAIFDAYNLILDDDENLLNPLRERILSERFSAEFAVTSQFEAIAEAFMQLDDAYMRQRVDDVFALRDQLMRALMGQKPASVPQLDAPTVIVGENLSPTDIAGLDLSRLAGVVCENGSDFGHMAILCRMLGIPAVVGLPGVTGKAHSGQMLALDGTTGEVWITPSEDEIAMLRRRGATLAEKRAQAQAFRGLPTVSIDGRRVELYASVRREDELEKALQADAEAIGLLRTEQLHLAGAPSIPGEDEQFEIYRHVLQRMNGKAVTVRTFDDGGQASLLPLKSKSEANPVLGFRGIRMSLGRPSFFRNQLRALLRASAYGSLKVVFPMISSVEELERIHTAIASIKTELRREGLPFDDNMRIGAGIAVPAAALDSPAIAKMVDFIIVFVGELIQFTMAIDRTNPDLAYLYHQLQPPVLRLVQWTVDAAHKGNIPCVLSDETPWQELTLPFWLGIGVDAFSLEPASILPARKLLNSCSYAECKQLAEKVLAMEGAGEATKLLDAFNLERSR